MIESQRNRVQVIVGILQVMVLAVRSFETVGVSDINRPHIDLAFASGPLNMG